MGLLGGKGRFHEESQGGHLESARGPEGVFVSLHQNVSIQSVVALATKYRDGKLTLSSKDKVP